MTIPASRLPILCYHRVHLDNDPRTPPVVEGEYCGHVTLSVFRRQMTMLTSDDEFRHIVSCSAGYAASLTESRD